MHPKKLFTVAVGLMATTTALATPAPYRAYTPAIAERAPEPLSLTDIINGIKSGIDALKNQFKGKPKDGEGSGGGSGGGSGTPAGNGTVTLRLLRRAPQPQPEPLGLDDIISGVKAGIDLLKGLKGDGGNSGGDSSSGSTFSDIIAGIKKGIDSIKNLFGKKKGGDSGGSTGGGGNTGGGSTGGGSTGGGSNGGGSTGGGRTGGGGKNSTTSAFVRRRYTSKLRF